jgi:hypothetical protein
MVIPALRRRKRKDVSRLPIGIMLLALLAIAAIVLGLLALRGSTGPSASVGAPISLEGVGAYDPYGDNGREHDDDAPKVTDRNPSTYWTTERYNSFTKAGVGVVLDANGLVQLSRVTVVTDTPGFTAEIRATNVFGGVTQAVSKKHTVGRRTVFEIDPTGPKQYYVIWITKLPPGLIYAHVNEARAFGTST